MHEAHPHPVGNHARRTRGNFSQPHEVGLRRGRAEGGIVGPNAVLDLRAQQVNVTPRGRQLEITETGEGGRHAAHHRAGFGARMAVVEHIPHHRFAGPDERQRAGGRHAQVVHRLAAKKLAQRGAQHREAVGHAGIGGRAGAFQLQHPALAGVVDEEIMTRISAVFKP